jgi:hypothetical protein
MKGIILISLVIIIVLIPYLILLYKKISLTAKLFLITIIEINILIWLLAITFFSEFDNLIGILFIYNIIIWLSVLFNLFCVVLIWNCKKLCKQLTI